jgi:hypothetical protein
LSVVSLFILDGHISVSVRNPVSIELAETKRLDKMIFIMVNNTNRVKERDMAEVISLVFIVVTVLGCLGLVACGGAGGNGTTLPSNGETAPLGDDSTWDDIPVYSRAKQVQKGSWSIPPDEGK